MSHRCGSLATDAAGPAQRACPPGLYWLSESEVGARASPVPHPPLPASMRGAKTERVLGLPPNCLLALVTSGLGAPLRRRGLAQPPASFYTGPEPERVSAWGPGRAWAGVVIGLCVWTPSSGPPEVGHCEGVPIQTQLCTLRPSPGRVQAYLGQQESARAQCHGAHGSVKASPAAYGAWPRAKLASWALNMGPRKREGVVLGVPGTNLPQSQLTAVPPRWSSQL